MLYVSKMILQSSLLWYCYTSTMHPKSLCLSLSNAKTKLGKRFNLLELTMGQNSIGCQNSAETEAMPQRIAPYAHQLNGKI